MSSRILLRSLITTVNQTLTHRLSTTSTTILRLRPLIAAATNFRHASLVATGTRSFSTRQTKSSLKDSNNTAWSNKPPKETILLDGCDFEHWLVVVEKPEGEPSRDEIIDSYINTLAKVVGTYDEARMKIYSVSTRCYYAFGALVSEEDSYKLKELPGVRWVLPDSYLDVKNKDYGGEPFIDGKAVPYEPKYHEEWMRNNARANERNKRNDRPRNFDRSRNFERRRENVQQKKRLPPAGLVASDGLRYYGGEGDGMGGPPNTGVGQPTWCAPGSSYDGDIGGAVPLPNNMGGGMPPSNMDGGMPNSAPNYQQPPNMGLEMPNNAPNQQQQQPSYAQNYGSAPYQSGPGQSSFAPNVGGRLPCEPQDMPGRDMPTPPNYSQNYQ
uniref:multiple organellar RNA editing factor 8, chloroplastic/mitochondrial-like n=1 Tax=Erigeron canadensis TaxID=72917 RepID=UPI001CB89B19|nr:multiple organellar RNA editing factor 8, chloroplastic/mitochondrial-like [Erigeron canadensis]